MRPWQLEVLTGLGAGLVFAILTRLMGTSPLISVLEGTAFAVAWVATGLFLRRRGWRR